MEELKQYTDNCYFDVEDIVNALLKVSGVTEEAKESLTDAVYNLKAIAQNEYNHDYHRVLYNTLLLMAEKNQ